MTNNTPEIASQRQFESLDDFVKNSNNFYLYFLDDCFVGKIYRGKEVFKRFQENHPMIEQETTQRVVADVRNKETERYHRQLKKETWERLLNVYKLMSKLTYAADEHVIRDGQPDDWYLCR